MARSKAADKSPGFPCDDCRRVDWVWDKKFRQWKCYTCTVAGKPMISRASGPTMEIREWADQVWQSFDDACEALYKLQATEPDGEVERLMNKAMVAAAEHHQQQILRLSEVAAEIGEIADDCKGGGEIYLMIPELDVEKRLTWGDPERTQREREADSIPF